MKEYGEYKFTKGKLNKNRWDKVRERRARTQGRIFLTSKDMSEAKLDEAIAHSVAKREGKKIIGVRQYPCGCGGYGCNITIPKENSQVRLAKTPKKPTKHTKRKSHYMFSGKVIK